MGKSQLFVARLDGRVEIDDAYLGGEKPGKCGLGSENKTAFVAAVQTNSDGKPRFICLTPVAGFSHEASSPSELPGITGDSLL